MDPETQNISDVIIIGAGISGLAAAHHLVKNDCKNIKILEARNRTGGRIHTIQFGDTNGDSVVAEMGANWIHGEKCSPMYRLADSCNLMESAVTHDEFAGIYINENGHPTDKGLVTEVSSMFKQIIDEVIDMDVPEERSSMSCAQYLQKRITSALCHFQESQKDDASNIFNCLRDICREDCGDDLNNLSLKYGGFNDDFKNINFLIPDGYASLLKHFECDVIDHVEFETKVKTIDWVARQTDCTKPVVVTCENQGVTKTYLANAVLSTLPLGVLKSCHKALFSPKLPDPKILAIDNLGFGKVNKILLYYKDPFWNPDSSGYKLVWQKTQPPLLDIKSWAREITAFKAVKTKPNLLVAWVCGDAAVLAEQESLAEVSDTCTQILRNFLQDPSIPNPDNIKMSNWVSDPFCRGSYTYIRPGRSPADMDLLAEPVSDKDGRPILLFAGEATDTESYGSTTGAMITGVRQASSLLQGENKSKL